MENEIELEGGGEEGVAPWMATFADMSTLLLTFFVLLLSFANTDAKEFREALGSVREALGVSSKSEGQFMALSTSLFELSDTLGYDRLAMFDAIESGKPEVVGPNGIEEAVDEYLRSEGVDAVDSGALAEEAVRLIDALADEEGASAEAVLQQFLEAQGGDPDAAEGILFVARQKERRQAADQKVAQTVEERFAQQGVDFQVDVTVIPRGVMVRLSDTTLFESGGARLLPGSEEVVELVADLAKRLPDPLSIEGHTDDRPIRTGRFPSNWELSTARAVSVMRALERAGVNPGRMRVAGFGELRPIASNATPQGRARNRRVEFVFERAG